MARHWSSEWRFIGAFFALVAILFFMASTLGREITPAHVVGSLTFSAALMALILVGIQIYQKGR